MSEEIVLVRDEERGVVLNPSTGEMVGPESTDEDIARLLDWLGDARNRVQSVRALVGSWVLSRMDHDARWTRDAGPFVLHSTSPTAAGSDYDAAQLEALLAEFVERGLISDEAAARCWRRAVDGTAVGAVAKALPPADQERLKRARKPARGMRSVSVKPR